MIRKLTQEDYLYIISRLNDWWGGRDMQDQLPRLFVKHFADTCLVAEEDERVVGFVIGFLSQSNADAAYIHFAGVDPEYRRRKVGESLYHAFFSLAAQKGRTRVCSCTSIVNRLSLAFHTGIGFRVKENDLKVDGVSYFDDYDGIGDRKFLFEIDVPRLI